MGNKTRCRARGERVLVADGRRQPEPLLCPLDPAAIEGALGLRSSYTARSVYCTSPPCISPAPGVQVGPPPCTHSDLPPLAAHQQDCFDTVHAVSSAACRVGARGLPPLRAVHASAAAASPDTLVITRPDDWHLHVRDGAGLQSVVPHSARQFRRAVIMPNLAPPVTTTEQALAYQQRVEAAAPAGAGFTPLMTLYLTDATPPDEVTELRGVPAFGLRRQLAWQGRQWPARLLLLGCSCALALRCRQVYRAREAGVVAFKLYPAGATTNSASGVTDIDKCLPTLRAMAEVRRPRPLAPAGDCPPLRCVHTAGSSGPPRLPHSGALHGWAPVMSPVSTACDWFCAGRCSAACTWRGDRPCRRLL